jgi:hypothetical protein
MSHHFRIWLSCTTGWSTSAGWAVALQEHSRGKDRLAQLFRLVAQYRRLEPVLRFTATRRTRAPGEPTRIDIMRYAPTKLHFLRLCYGSGVRVSPIGIMAARRAFSLMMNKVGGVALGLALTAPLALVVHQTGPFLAYNRVQDLAWSRSASPREQRENAHEALRFVLGDPHDAFGTLLRYGDASSVEPLRRALARQSPDDLACTWEHGERALARALTR